MAGRTAIQAGPIVWWRALVAAASLMLLFGIALSEGLVGEGSSVPSAPRTMGFAHKGLARLPAAAQGEVSASLGADDPAYRVIGSGTGFEAQSAAQRLRVRFGSSGVQIASGSTLVGLSLHGVGYGASIQAVGSVRPTATANRVMYTRSRAIEWYRNGPLGLEQGFTIPQTPSRRETGPLTLSMALSGDTRAWLASDGRTVTFRHAGSSSLRYGGLVATDARGRALHAWLKLRSGQILLHVDADGAHYPLRIDPFVQQGEKLTGGGAIANPSVMFGSSVALSADGNTALIGGPSDNGKVGAAWVFTRSGSTWTQQGEKLTANDEVGEGDFGESVALSADGNTVLIGGEGDSNGVGAAWLFTRSGSTWTQQGKKLTGNGEVGYKDPELGEVGGAFGARVALSGDGNTALISGVKDSALGAAWVFTRLGSQWTQQGGKLTAGEEHAGPNYASGEDFGASLALSADGNTALIGGGCRCGPSSGVAWVFTRSNSQWAQQGPKLTTSDLAFFGYSVALSADGNTALIGGPYDGGFAGAAWVYTRSGSTWTQQGEKLTANDEGHFGSEFGASVALSADGNTALIGGPYSGDFVGAAWEFRRSTSTWTQQSEAPYVPGEVRERQFGSSVALSSDGDTVLIGGPGENAAEGAAWVFTGSSSSPTPLWPGVTTESAGSVSSTSVTLNGTVTSENPVTDCHFEYGETLAYGGKAPCPQTVPASQSPVSVSANITGLTPATTYHFALDASNAHGTGYGTDSTFTTAGVTTPTVQTGYAYGGWPSSATLTGGINPHGNDVTYDFAMGRFPFPRFPRTAKFLRDTGAPWPAREL